MIAIDNRDNISILKPNAWICSKYSLHGCPDNLLSLLVGDSFALAAQWQVHYISMLHLITVGCWWSLGMWFKWPERCVLYPSWWVIFEKQETNHVQRPELFSQCSCRKHRFLEDKQINMDIWSEEKDWSDPSLWCWKGGIPQNSANMGSLPLCGTVRIQA